MIDPITLERLQPPVFKLIDSNGHVHAFDPTTLAQYFTSSGNFINPVTREEVNSVELGRLQRLLPDSEAPLVEIRQQLEQDRRLEMERDADLNAAQLQVILAYQEILEFCLSGTYRVSQYRILLRGIHVALHGVAEEHGVSAAVDTVRKLIELVESQLNVFLVADTRVIPDLITLLLFFTELERAGENATL